MRETVEVRQRATLVRVPRDDYQALKRLCSTTRISQSTFNREALADLLEHKYAGCFTSDALA